MDNPAGEQGYQVTTGKEPGELGDAEEWLLWSSYSLPSVKAKHSRKKTGRETEVFPTRAWTAVSVR